MICLIDNYDSFTYNLYQYFWELGAECRVFRNDEIGIDGIENGPYDRLVISPGPGMPDGAGITLEAIRHFAGRLPILGVCLGHQAIGQVFGGTVVRAPELVHGKTSEIHHDGKSLFRGLPEPFAATRYHSLILDRERLPEILEISAWVESGLIMGVRHRRLPIEGVQFHPESILTLEGKNLLKNFLGLAVDRQQEQPC
ncbi:MAG: aminodeoxychorismate/anthranilate synthase component II [Acidobacteria bacterium]|nr:aminodeoxychorismate/anthranilate synthase component II [Acidobacteriota bacterium]